MYITPRGFELSWDEDEEGSTMVVWCGVAAAMERNFSLRNSSRAREEGGETTHLR